MKERLKELAEQAFFETKNDYAQNLPETMEKFADLIVKECINTLNWHGVDDGVPYIEYMAKAKLGVMKLERKD